MANIFAHHTTTCIGMMLFEAKKYLRVPRIFGEADSTYHRRIARTLRGLKQALNIPDVDVFILHKMFSFAGHLVRKGEYLPEFLPARVLLFRCKAECRTVQTFIGSQMHPKRFSPWSWERQFDTYFSQRGLSWIEVAKDKSMWNSHQQAWIECRVRHRAEYGRL